MKYILERGTTAYRVVKKDTGYKKPGMAITTAIYSYFRYQETIKRLIAENIQLRSELAKYE